MTRKSERRSPHTVLGRAGGEPESSKLHDPRLTPGVVLNGDPALLSAGDTSAKLVRVTCWCGALVAEVWMNTPARGEPFWSITTLVVEDAEARPVVMRHAESLLKPRTRRVRTSCPAHGPLTVPAAPLLQRGRSALGRAEGEKLATFVAPRVS